MIRDSRAHRVEKETGSDLEGEMAGGGLHVHEGEERLCPKIENKVLILLQYNLLVRSVIFAPRLSHGSPTFQIYFSLSSMLLSQPGLTAS